MSRSILFYADKADELNSYVADTIAPHLFLSCHYMPEATPVFHTDAKFLRGILNLYKYTHDSSIIERLQRLATKSRISYRNEEFNEILRDIQTLRAMESHNVSETEYDTWYAKWCIGVIGKEKISSPDDYDQALTALENMGEDLCNILYEYIRQMAISKNKERLIKDWEGLILAFYAKKGNSRVFEEQLWMAYLSRCSGNLNYLNQDPRKRYKLALWCKNFFLAKDENLIKLYEGILSKQCASLDAQKRRQIEDSIRNAENRICGTNQKIAAKMHCSDAENMNVYIYMEYYIANLSDALREMLEDVKKDKNGTMYPEDIMQRLIEKDFGAVYSDDF